MHAPVDEGAAAGDLLGGKCSAQTRNRAVSAEGDVYVVDLTQLPCLDPLADLVDGGVEAVDHANVQSLPRLVLDVLHHLGFGIGAGGRLLA